MGKSERQQRETALKASAPGAPAGRAQLGKTNPGGTCLSGHHPNSAPRF